MLVRRLLVLVVFGCVVFLNREVVAAEPLAKIAPDFAFESIGLAKLTIKEGQSVVAFRFPNWKSETREKEMTEMVQEIRTRTVNGKNGVVEETYTVNVPVVKTVRKTVYIPVEPEKLDVGLNELKAWSTKGKPIAKQELEKLLTKATYVIALPREIAPGELPIDSFFAAALRPDLIFVSSRSLSELYKEEPPVAPAAPQPATDPSA